MKGASILVVDDHAVVRRGLRALLEGQPNWEVVGEASSGREAAKKAAELKPDIVILDISMPGLNGLDATPLILAAAPKTRVLILSMHQSEELIEKTLKAGARGYVLKSDAEQDLITAVAALLQNKTFFTSLASEFVLDRLRGHGSRQRRQHGVNGLSAREREVMQLLAEGSSNKDVAAQLHISVRTAENHRARIMQKLQLRSFSDLVRHAIRSGIVQL